MNFRRNHRKEVAVEAAALSDILFVLLVFFLIMSTLASANAIKLTLPKASTGQTVPNKQRINLYVREENGQIEYYIEKDPTTIDQMEASLEQISSKMEKPSVLLRADQSLTYGEVIKVIDVCTKAGLPVTAIVEKAK
jgi:biopolymer transport protein ExbD